MAAHQLSVYIRWNILEPTCSTSWICLIGCTTRRWRSNRRDLFRHITDFEMNGNLHFNGLKQMEVRFLQRPIIQYWRRLCYMMATIYSNLIFYLLFYLPFQHFLLEQVIQTLCSLMQLVLLSSRQIWRIGAHASGLGILERAKIG